MSITFVKPASREGWPSALEDIISAARVALQNPDKNAGRSDLSAANTALNKFIDALDNSDFWTHDLDHAAREAIGYVAVDITTATVEDIAGRTDALRELANSVNATAADNEQTAA